MPFRVPFRLRFRGRPLRVADLAWIDGFYGEMGRYLFLREEDGVVILPPNQVYKANPSGISALISLVESLMLSNEGGLLGKLREIQASIEDGRTRAACNQLGAFMNQVGNLVRNGRIDAETADEIINLVEAIQASLGCR
jgi:hypothetical protein